MLDEPAGLGSIEAVEQHQRRPGQKRERNVTDQARDVKQGREAEDDIGMIEIHPDLVNRRGEDDVTVRIHRAFRLARRA